MAKVHVLWCLGALALGAPSASAAPARRAVRPAPRPKSALRHAPAPPVTRPSAPVLKSLQLLPAQVGLRGAEAQQRLVALGTYADGSVRDLSTQVKYASAQPGVAAVSPAGVIRPVADGAATVKAYLGRIGAQVPVQVEASRDAALSFARDVAPILTQAGCNSLTCHGSPAGKGGFRLSMYGFDPAQDHAAITKQERTVPEKGKRVDLASVENSLILRKPLMLEKHQGGMRFKPDSPEHRTLLAWLRAGANPDSAEATPTVTRLEVLPGERVLAAAGERQRLVVMAHFSDGSQEDVTHRAIYASNDDAVATVEADGAATGVGVGETSVLARYLGRVGAARLLLPQPTLVPEREYAGFRPVNYVDQHALARWKKMRFVPAAPCTDTEFLRRVSLDLTGTLPQPEEIRAFLADGTAGKRARKIDELLGRPDYADWWTVFWGDLLRNNSKILQANGAKAYWTWIRQSVADNKPYDRFVRELITATGDTFNVGPANFYRVANTPGDHAEQVAQLFLGVRLQCANCHNHPSEKWTRTNYHQFAAFFARVQARNRNGASDISVLPRGEQKHPETNQALAPAVLGEQTVDAPAAGDRREPLAEWLVSPDNALFARNLVNRLWVQLFGRGLVEPVDDVRATNPATNEALLDALAKDFVAHRFDIKHVLRTMANSSVYQLSTRATARNAKDASNFSRAYYRRLKAEALLDAVCAATGVPETFNGYPKGTRAVQLMDNRVNSYFMDIFGRPRREMVCTCEREETANLTQALHFINGSTVNQKISSASGRITEYIRAAKPDAEIVEELYLRTLSRPPAPEELRKALEALAGAKTKQQGFEDRLWVLLNSREFLFNH